MELFLEFRKLAAEVKSEKKHRNAFGVTGLVGGMCATRSRKRPANIDARQLASRTGAHGHRTDCGTFNAGRSHCKGLEVQPGPSRQTA